jgi:glycosyltransferase involved in cell wall biosynthesis
VVHCVPNPPLPYWDAVSPIKLFDDMASGRPLVVTPRVVMRADVERHKCGLVASGDRPEDLADALARVLSDEAAARAMGANGRAAAVAEHDWRLISRQVAEAVLRVSAAS